MKEAKKQKIDQQNANLPKQEELSEEELDAVNGALGSQYLLRPSIKLNPNLSASLKLKNINIQGIQPSCW